MPTVVPMIAYEDAGAALDWLAKAFGFVETTRMAMDDGSIGHAEMTIGEGLIMLAEPTADYESPRHHRETCAQSAKWQSVPWVIDGLYVSTSPRRSFNSSRVRSTSVCGSDGIAVFLLGGFGAGLVPAGAGQGRGGGEADHRQPRE